MAIQFLNNVNADNGVLYVDAVNNKVGIGTTNPQRKLSIENGGFNMFAAGGTSADAFSVVTHNYLFSDENEDSVYSYTNSEHEFSTQGTPRVTIDSTGLVGIGTTSPGSLLHVSNGELDVSGGDGYKIEDNPWAYWASDLLTLGDWDGVGYSTRIMGSNSSEVMRVTGNNVGIGTTNPSEKLEVVGAIKMSENASYPLTIDHDSTTTTNEITTVGSLNIVTGSNNTISFKDSTTTNMSISGYSGDVLMGYNTGKVGIGTTSPTDKLTVEDGNIRLNSTSSYPAQGLYAYWNNGSPNMGGISWHNNPGFIGSEWSHYKQSSPYTLARIRLIGDASSGGMFVNLNNSDVFTIKTSSGNVGIGETNPAQKLHVIGNSEITGDIFLGRYIFHNDDTNTWLGFPLADTISFRTNGSDRMYINSSGNVGIGTTSPSAKLHVSGDGMFGGTTTSANTALTVKSRSGDVGDIRIRFDAAGTTQRSYISDYYTGEASNIGFERNNSTGTGVITFDTSNSSFSPSERMRISSGGNVGIGTTAPGAKLEVNGNSRFVGSMQLYQGSTSNLYLNILQSSSNTYINTGTSGETIYFGAPASNTTNINIQGTATATNFILSSDKILKENIKNLEPKHLDIKWKSFELKSEPGINRVGVIAQELEKTNPEFVREDKDGLKSVAYIDLLINKIAELEARLEKAGL